VTVQWWCSARGVAWEWSWQAYPGVWVFVAAVGASYAWMLRRASGAGARPEELRWRAGCFAGGTVVLWLALDWPLGALGAGYLASAHMLQFLLIALVAPPLLLLGISPAHDGTTRPTPAKAAVGSAHPLACLIVFNVIVAVTHVPAVVDTLMPSQLGSFAVDLAWLAGGLFFWWPVVGPALGGARLHEIFRVAYVGIEGLALTPLFVLLTFSPFPLYATYELAPRVHEISARTDQQLAGLFMKVGGMLILLVAIGLLFLKWTRREGLADAEPGLRRRSASGGGGEA
jgi:cytochrome c oxidase assembly factor CtaG